MTESADVGQIVQVFSSIMSGCPICRETGGSGDEAKFDVTYLETRVNHLLAHHHGRLLHVGQQSDTDGDGNPWHMTSRLSVSRASPLD
jgi:hypothetical protein